MTSPRSDYSKAKASSYTLSSNPGPPKVRCTSIAASRTIWLISFSCIIHTQKISASWRLSASALKLYFINFIKIDFEFKPLLIPIAVNFKQWAGFGAAVAQRAVFTESAVTLILGQGGILVPEI